MSRGGRVATSPDVQRMGASMAGPGMDTRQWIELAIVTEIDLDPQHGMFATVRFMPSGDEDQVQVGTLYSGNGFGIYVPIKVNDTVVVATPNGDPDHGGVIIAKMWDTADKPPSEAGTHDSPSDDLVIRIEGEKSLRVVVSGAGNIVLKVLGDGQVYLGDDSGTEPVGMGQSIKDYLQSIHDKYVSHTHTVPITGAAGTTPTTVPLDLPPLAPPTDAVKATKAQAK